MFDPVEIEQRCLCDQQRSEALAELHEVVVSDSESRRELQRSGVVETFARVLGSCKTRTKDKRIVSEILFYLATEESNRISLVQESKALPLLYDLLRGSMDGDRDVEVMNPCVRCLTHLSLEDVNVALLVEQPHNFVPIMIDISLDGQLPRGVKKYAMWFITNVSANLPGAHAIVQSGHVETIILAMDWTEDPKESGLMALRNIAMHRSLAMSVASISFLQQTLAVLGRGKFQDPNSHESHTLLLWLRLAQLPVLRDRLLAASPFQVLRKISTNCIDEYSSLLAVLILGFIVFDEDAFARKANGTFEDGRRAMECQMRLVELCTLSIGQKAKLIRLLRATMWDSGERGVCERGVFAKGTMLAALRMLLMVPGNRSLMDSQTIDNVLGKGLSSALRQTDGIVDWQSVGNAILALEETSLDASLFSAAADLLQEHMPQIHKAVANCEDTSEPVPKAVVAAVGRMSRIIFPQEPPQASGPDVRMVRAAEGGDTCKVVSDGTSQRLLPASRAARTVDKKTAPALPTQEGASAPKIDLNDANEAAAGRVDSAIEPASGYPSVTLTSRSSYAPLYPEQQEDDIADEDDGTTCPVCLTARKGAVLAPCGHTFCRQCSYRLRDAKEPCPVCRQPIDMVVKAYF